MEKSFFDENYDERDERENLNSPKNRRSPRSTFYAIFDFIKTAIIIIFFALVIRLFVIQPFIVEGQSMLPTFANNDYLITEKISYLFRSPLRGEVIIFNPPDNPNVNYIKRVVGLPGDEIEIKDSNIYINSQKISESYLSSDESIDKPTENTKINLKNNEYFLLGDNRSHSRDSREIGPVPKTNIVSRIWVRLLPVDNIRAFAAVEYDNLDKTTTN